MKQVLIKQGRVVVEEVPAPMVSEGGVLIKVVSSCISAGTELSSLQTSGKSLIRRALEQPDQVRKVFNMARSEGIAKTMAEVRGVLESGIPTGYSLAGIVMAAGKGIRDLQPGDRVAAAGAGVANHAEYVDVPRNLVMQIPDSLDFPQASTVTLGGIAMQGVRRAQVQLGEYVVVFGAGILGQLALQMLVASGARVIAVDLHDRRLELARRMGAEVCLNPSQADSIEAVHHYTNGYGADVVLFCAATENSQALSDAFAMTRKKGRLVMVGVWGRELKREDIYAKELDFLISTSYGPGRYDPNYEDRGLDYPYAYVRWTENRNMEEYLRLIEAGRIQVEPLIEGTYPLEEVEQAFGSLQSPDPPLLVLLDYGDKLPDDVSALVQKSRRVENQLSYRLVTSHRIRVGIIGAGDFATSVHLPNLERLKKHYQIRAICNRTGHKSQAFATRFGAEYSSTDYREVVSDPNIDLVMICTRHNLHGQMALESLQAGKHTFVEKPLCTKQGELNAIKEFYSSCRESPKQEAPLLMVGFNRRFSPYAKEVKKRVTDRINPLFFHYRMNAGYLSFDHWVHGEEGGGRIIGEACHVIDLFSFLTESPVRSFGTAKLTPRTGSVDSSDNMTIALEYMDGSLATLEYFAVGSNHLSKELLEVHFDGKSIIVDDYKSIHGFGIQVADIKHSSPAKGHLEEMELLAECILGKKDKWPIPWESIVETTELTLEMSRVQK
jgi:predicted dehydrogenase/threonine dehydrogenase-like Zn-dependent dehydrogenase